MSAGAPQAALAKLVYANVMDRQAITIKSLRQHCTPTVSLYVDSPTMREVRELRIFAHGGAVLATRRLFDFDADKKRWKTEGVVRRQVLDDPRAVRDMAASMLAEIEIGDLAPYEGNTVTHESFYPRAL